MRAWHLTVAGVWLATFLVAASGFTASGCFVFISTGPTHVKDGTIVFVVKDDHDGFVAQVHIEVVAVSGTWRSEGFTHGDGAFRCDVQGTVDQVRVGVTPPDGFGLFPSETWPKTMNVAAGEQETTLIRVRRLR